MNEGYDQSAFIQIQDEMVKLATMRLLGFKLKVDMQVTAIERLQSKRAN